MCCGILYLVQYQLIGKGGMTSGGIAEATIFFLKNPISIWKGLVGYAEVFFWGIEPWQMEKYLQNYIC